MCEELYNAMEMNNDEMEAAMFRMLAGKAVDKVFSDTQVTKGKKWLENWCEQWGRGRGVVRSGLQVMWTR